MNETLTQRQLDREQNQIERGVEQYRKLAQVRNETELTPGQMLLRRALRPLTATLSAMIDAVESGKAGRGRPSLATQYVRLFEPEAVAYITARCCLDAAGKAQKLTRTAVGIAEALSDQYLVAQMRENDAGLVNHIERKVAKRTKPHHKRAILRHAVDLTSVVGLSWSEGDKLKVGMKLVELFIETTGLAELRLSKAGGGKTVYELVPTQQTAEWLARMHGKCELLEPKFMPMVVPPKPWTSAISGGYLTDECRVDLVKTVLPGYRDEALSCSMPEVFDAINTIQSTPWRINRAVFNVLVEAWSSHARLGGLPALDDEPLPARPIGIPEDVPLKALPADVREELLRWKAAACSIHESNASLRSQRLAAAQKISMASSLKDEERFYFPHNLDFRGRVYSLVSGVNPQADDLGKGLLEFADGKPLGEYGGYWLCVHIANLFGIDKVSFDERVAWVRDFEKEILDSALSPLDGFRFWTTADSPWCALAACFEYAGWKLMGNDYVSHLPIAMDGSCSGLQHFSAMLKDADGGRAVNLTPTDSPADIYTAVAEKVEAMLLQDNEQLAISWRGKVTRKIVKRPCMTFAYSVTSRGMRDQILDEMRKANPGGDYLPGWDNFEAANYLAPVVEAAIRATVDRASEAMGWLQEVARTITKAGLPINWWTPVGLPVQQVRRRMVGQKHTVWFQGKQMRLTLSTSTSKLDARGQKSSIAPNFVHSMDAAHLMMVVNRMRPVSTHFAMIHDSFGVHACDVDDLHFAIRDEFIKLYSVDRLTEFRDQVLSYLPEELHGDVPPCPKAGTLDLDGIRAAEFFFA